MNMNGLILIAHCIHCGSSLKCIHTVLEYIYIYIYICILYIQLLPIYNLAITCVIIYTGPQTGTCLTTSILLTLLVRLGSDHCH